MKGGGIQSERTRDTLSSRHSDPGTPGAQRSPCPSLGDWQGILKNAESRKRGRGDGWGRLLWAYRAVW